MRRILLLASLVLVGSMSGCKSESTTVSGITDPEATKQIEQQALEGARGEAERQPNP